MSIVAGLAAMVTSAYAWSFDAQISIDRALNSPTLTVRYAGASNVALVEFKLNGQSIGTRAVSPSKAAGETNFTIDLSSLNDGDNEVEIRLLDKSGKLVSSEKTYISSDEGQDAGPIFLSTPKMGATVLGPVEIKVGFGREMRDTYVSFFIDNQFKSLKNVPPFTYLWDSSRETNGWHELEAWVIDNTSATYKTRKVRVFVNNPSGNTPRKTVETPKVPAPKPIDLTPTTAAIKPMVAGTASGLKSVAPGAAGAAASGVKTGIAPRTLGVLANSTIVATPIGQAAGAKAAPIKSSVATGVRLMTPTGTRVAVAAPKVVVAPQVKTAPVVSVKPTVKPVVASGVAAVKVAATTIAITKGQRIPNIGAFAVVFNTQMVSFDVPTRVDGGVPMTPFRHLIEKAGGKVDWESMSKSISANAEGREIYVQIGDKIARINKIDVELELAPYIDRGRTIVPLSFIRDTLNVDIEYDKETGHVLIKSRKS